MAILAANCAATKAQTNKELYKGIVANETEKAAARKATVADSKKQQLRNDALNGGSDNKSAFYWELITGLALIEVGKWKKGESADNIKRHPNAGGLLTVQSILATNAVGWCKGLTREIERAYFAVVTYDHVNEVFINQQDTKARALMIANAIDDKFTRLLARISEIEVLQANNEGTRAPMSVSEILRRARYEAANEGSETVSANALRNEWQLPACTFDLVERFEEQQQAGKPVADRRFETNIDDL